jgi:hypothetical protein
MSQSMSSGQWGSAAIGALALACLGLIVLTHAKRAETTFGFLGFYALLLFGRALWLGDPLTIPMHQLQNGALLVFAFFSGHRPSGLFDAGSRRRIRDPVCPVSTSWPDSRPCRHGTSCARDRLPVSGNDLSLEALRR